MSTNRYIFYNEEWNDTENNICPIHYIEKDVDGFCNKCLEEKNNKFYVAANYRESQRVYSPRKKGIGKFRTSTKKSS